LDAIGIDMPFSLVFFLFIDLQKSILYLRKYVREKMKNIRLEIRLTEYESRQLEQEAVKRGMTKSELIRSLVARLPAPV
jgi:hypothetical protein